MDKILVQAISGKPLAVEGEPTLFVGMKQLTPKEAEVLGADKLGHRIEGGTWALTGPVVIRLRFQDPAKIPPIRLKVEGLVEEVR